MVKCYKYFSFSYCISGCGKDKEDNKNHGCASPAPHGDVLKKAKEQLKKKVMI